MRAEPFFDFSVWMEIKDGDDCARAVFDRHYSRYHYKDGRKPKLFVGPGEKMVLTTPCGRAIFVWRKFISADHQTGINCAVFRNEIPKDEVQASDLILAAEDMARKRWPGERFFTYVNPRGIRSTNPGYCFKRAGWSFIGITKARKYHILAKEPPAPFDHVWRWKVNLPERYGTPCRVTARGKMNSIEVEFEDGVRHIASRYAVRRAKP